MATANVSIGSTYTLVTAATTFIAQNNHYFPQEWARASSLPPETLTGIVIEPKQGMTGSDGSDSLYARGGGIVVVVT